MLYALCNTYDAQNARPARVSQSSCEFDTPAYGGCGTLCDNERSAMLPSISTETLASFRDAMVEAVGASSDESSVAGVEHSSSSSSSEVS